MIVKCTLNNANSKTQNNTNHLLAVAVSRRHRQYIKTQHIHHTNTNTHRKTKRHEMHMCIFLCFGLFRRRQHACFIPYSKNT